MNIGLIWCFSLSPLASDTLTWGFDTWTRIRSVFNWGSGFMSTSLLEILNCRIFFFFFYLLCIRAFTGVVDLQYNSVSQRIFSLMEFYLNVFKNEFNIQENRILQIPRSASLMVCHRSSTAVLSFQVQVVWSPVKFESMHWYSPRSALGSRTI